MAVAIASMFCAVMCLVMTGWALYWMRQANAANRRADNAERQRDDWYRRMETLL